MAIKQTAAKTVKVTLARACIHNGKERKPGDVVEVTEEQAKSIAQAPPVDVAKTTA